MTTGDHRMTKPRIIRDREILAASLSALIDDLEKAQVAEIKARQEVEAIETEIQKFRDMLPDVKLEVPAEVVHRAKAIADTERKRATD